jgi:hypothetical protein
MTSDNLTCPRCAGRDARLTWQTAVSVARAEGPPAEPDLFAGVG